MFIAVGIGNIKDEPKQFSKTFIWFLMLQWAMWMHWTMRMRVIKLLVKIWMEIEAYYLSMAKIMGNEFHRSMPTVSMISFMYFSLWCALRSLTPALSLALWMIGARLMRHMYAYVGLCMYACMCACMCMCVRMRLYKRIFIPSVHKHTSALCAHNTLKIRLECCLQSHSLCFV